MCDNFSTKQNTYCKICPESEYLLQFDGCSKGNPGLSGAGAVIYYMGEEIWSNSFYVGEKETNNYAEYTGLIKGLEYAIHSKIQKINIEGDSLLVINHMKDIYKCKSNNLLPLYKKAKELSNQFENIQYKHVLRNKNKRADRLSNIAIENVTI